LIRKCAHRYVQGSGALAGIAARLEDPAAVVAAGARAWRAARSVLAGAGAVRASERRPVTIGDSRLREIARLEERCREISARSIVALGGGRVIDAAKVAADRRGLPLTVVPTVLSSDAACSAVAVLYDDEGRFLEYVDLTHSPEMVVADTGLLGQSPGRLFAAGAVGALSVAFESAERLSAGQFAGPAAAARGYRDAARRMRETLLSVDPDRLRNPSRLDPSELEDVVYLALSQGAELFENVGLSLAHAVYRACRALGLSGRDGLLHGELVGLGLLVQLRVRAPGEAGTARAAEWVGRVLAGTDWSAVERALGSRRAEFLFEITSSPLARVTGAPAEPAAVLDATTEVVRGLS
jgi:glycerol dehydrogenase